jgi:DNA-binding transcriptional LysR family regulator
MNVRFLETFVWLAQLRNFRMTAEKLHTTQAAVSSRIATLEQELGARLFERGVRDVALTLQGSKALVYAERLVRTMQEMREGMADPSLYAGVVRIGVIESIIHSWFPQFIAGVHRHYPRLEIELTGDTTIHLIDQFSRGNLDLVLQTDPVVGPMVQNLPLCEFPMRWVGATSLGLHNDKLTLTDLAAFPILSFSRNSGPHKFIERLYARHVDKPIRVNCMTSASALVQLAVDAFGVALIPPAIIARELREETVRLLNVDVEMPVLPLIASFRSSPDSPLFERVAQLAQETAQTYARSVADEIARVPLARPEAMAWQLAQGGSTEKHH